MSKKSSAKTKKLAMQTIVNRRARFDYELGDEIVAGLSLTGLEVRAAREGHVQLKGAARTVDTSPRKLLASRRQIDQLAARKKEGFTIVPTKLLTSGRYIKLVIALGKGKKRYDKRQAIKQRDLEREHSRILRKF